MKPEAFSQQFSGIVAASSDRGQCIEFFYLKICIHCKTQHHPSSTVSASALLNHLYRKWMILASLSCGLHSFLIASIHTDFVSVPHTLKPLTWSQYLLKDKFIWHVKLDKHFQTTNPNFPLQQYNISIWLKDPEGKSCPVGPIVLQDNRSCGKKKYLTYL